MSKELCLEKGAASLRAARFAEATRHYQSALDLDPTLAEAWYGKARAEEGAGRYRAAIECFERSFELDGDGHGFIAIYAIGNCHAQLGELGSAISCYDEAIAIGPDRSRPLHNRARALVSMRRYGEAAEGFRRVTELESASAAGWVWFAHCLAQLGRVAESEAASARGNSLAPQEAATAWMAVGQLERQRKNLQAALAAFDHALSLRPLWGIAHESRAVCLATLGRNDEALNANRQAAACDDRLALTALVDQGALHARAGRFKASAAAYAGALARVARSAQDHASRGLAFLALRRFDEARASFARARKLAPGRSDHAFQEAVCLEQLGQLAAAIEAFEAVVQDTPDMADAWLRLAGALVKSGDHARALAACKRAEQSGVVVPELNFHKGCALLALSRNEDATPCFESVVAVDPSSSGAWANLAACRVRLGQHEQALVALDRVLEDDPRSVDAWRARGDALRALGREQEADASLSTGFAIHLLDQNDAEQALGYLRNASGLDERNWIAPRIEGDIWLQGGRLSEALAAYDRVVALRPADALAWTTRGVVLERLGRADEALESSGRAVEADPGSAMAHRNHGLALLERERPEDALVYYQRALEIDGESPNAWYGTGVARARTDDLLGAIVAFRRTVEIDENDADAWADLGRCLASLRRFREASEAWARVAALDPGKVPSEADEIREAGCHPSPIDLCSRLAYARMRAGDNAGAASAFDEALAHDPGQVDLWCDRGICEELINGSEQALVYFERALECDGTSIRVWYNRGVSLQRLSRHEDAVRSFGRSIALHRERELPLDPDRLHAHHNLGLCLLEMGRRESALDQFDEVARCARSQPDRWAAEARLAERLKLTLFGV